MSQLTHAETTNQHLETPEERVRREIVALVAALLDLDRNAVPTDVPLTDLPDVDSIDLVEIVIGVEKHYRIRFPKRAAAQIRTVDQAVAHVLEQLEA